LDRIYLDNAATSFPKAPGVIEAMTNYMANIGTSVHRNLSKSYQAEAVVYNTRELICMLFHYDKPENVIFTKNITESLNLIIKGLLKPGDHVIVTSMEHNAVMRPLISLSATGVAFSRIICNNKGELDITPLNEHINPNTKAIIMTHASNVSGSLFPLAPIGELCKAHDLFFIVDSAQTAGCLEINMEEMKIDALAFTGHKSLLGPQGIGGIVIKDHLAEKIPPFIEGGTGSFSEFEEQPMYLPDKYEAGTPNLPGIFGLNASLHFLQKTGIKTHFDHETFLSTYFISEIMNMKQVKLVGPDPLQKRAHLVSVDFPGLDNAEIANKLLHNYNIITRVGLHCAPNAHRTLGTFPQGTVRFSFSSFNTQYELKIAVDAINTILKELG